MVDEPAKLQYDYAWKWFVFQTEQRTKMFSVMLTALAVMAVAYATALSIHIYIMALLIALTAVVLSICFARLDQRNQHLVWKGETALEHLETHAIFAADPNAPGTPASPGILSAGHRHSRSGKMGISDVIGGHHHAVLPVIAYTFAALFFALAAAALFYLFPVSRSGRQDHIWGALLPLLLFVAPIGLAAYEFLRTIETDENDETMVARNERIPAWFANPA